MVGLLLVIMLIVVERCVMVLWKVCCLGLSWDMGIIFGGDVGVIGGCD